MNKVWFITGCSTGFGRALATEVLQKGYNVVVTARKTADIEELVNSYPDNAIAVKLDVTSKAEIDSAVADGTQSVILPQVTYGIAVRMAVMSILAGN